MMLPRLFLYIIFAAINLSSFMVQRGSSFSDSRYINTPAPTSAQKFGFTSEDVVVKEVTTSLSRAVKSNNFTSILQNNAASNSLMSTVTADSVPIIRSTLSPIISPSFPPTKTPMSEPEEYFYSSYLYLLLLIALPGLCAVWVAAYRTIRYEWEKSYQKLKNVADNVVENVAISDENDSVQIDIIDPSAPVALNGNGNGLYTIEDDDINININNNININVETVSRADEGAGPTNSGDDTMMHSVPELNQASPLMDRSKIFSDLQSQILSMFLKSLELRQLLGIEESDTYSESLINTILDTTGKDESNEKLIKFTSMHERLKIYNMKLANALIAKELQVKKEEEALAVDKRTWQYVLEQRNLSFKEEDDKFTYRKGSRALRSSAGESMSVKVIRRDLSTKQKREDSPGRVRRERGRPVVFPGEPIPTFISPMILAGPNMKELQLMIIEDLSLDSKLTLSDVIKEASHTLGISDKCDQCENYREKALLILKTLGSDLQLRSSPSPPRIIANSDGRESPSDNAYIELIEYLISPSATPSPNGISSDKIETDNLTEETAIVRVRGRIPNVMISPSSSSSSSSSSTLSSRESTSTRKFSSHLSSASSPAARAATAAAATTAKTPPPPHPLSGPHLLKRFEIHLTPTGQSEEI